MIKFFFNLGETSIKQIISLHPATQFHHLVYKHKVNLFIYTELTNTYENR